MVLKRSIYSRGFRLHHWLFDGAVSVLLWQVTKSQTHDIVDLYVCDPSACSPDLCPTENVWCVTETTVNMD